MAICWIVRGHGVDEEFSYTRISQKWFKYNIVYNLFLWAYDYHIITEHGISKLLKKKVVQLLTKFKTQML